MALEAQADMPGILGSRALKPLIVIGLIFYFITMLLSLTPASIAAWAVHKAVPTLWLTSVEGTLWQGRAGGAQLELEGNAIPLGEVKWRLSPWTVLALKPCLYFDAQADGQTISGNFCQSPFGAASAEDVNIEVPIAVIKDLLPIEVAGQLSINVISADMSGQQVSALDARFSWQGASVNAGEAWMNLGSFGGEAQANGDGGIDARVFDIAGPFGVDMSAGWTLGSNIWNVIANITPKPDAPEIAVQGLQVLGEEVEPGDLQSYLASLSMNFCWVLSIGLLFFASPSRADWHYDQQAIMGTQINLTLWHDNPERGREALQAVMSEMQRINAALSPYIETSELSVVNKKAGKAPLPISQEMAFLLDKSLYYGHLSEGAFDITFASVARYYDYRKGKQPSDSQRVALVEAVDFRHIVLDAAAPSVAFSHPQVTIDLGGIAKGYAVDRASNILRTLGVKHATISAGGDSRVVGDKRGQAWMIGIKNPRQREGQESTLIRMPLANVAVSTSGDYERFFIDDNGERVHHILNPKTGASAHGVVSVTVLGAKGVDTDPLSTTVFVLGVEKGLALINKLPGYDCVIIDASGKAHYSDGLMEPVVN